MSTENTQVQQPQKVRITVSQILEDLNNGINRDGIAQKYSLSKKDVVNLFKHPKLKGRKVKSSSNFDLIDDTEVSESNEASPVSDNIPQPEVLASATVAEATDAPGNSEAPTTGKGVW